MRQSLLDRARDALEVGDVRLVEPDRQALAPQRSGERSHGLGVGMGIAQEDVVLLGHRGPPLASSARSRARGNHRSWDVRAQDVANGHWDADELDVVRKVPPAVVEGHPPARNRRHQGLELALVCAGRVRVGEQVGHGDVRGPGLAVAHAAVVDPHERAVGVAVADHAYAAANRGHRARALGEPLDADLGGRASRPGGRPPDRAHDLARWSAIIGLPDEPRRAGRTFRRRYPRHHQSDPSARLSAGIARTRRSVPLLPRRVLQPAREHPTPALRRRSRPVPALPPPDRDAPTAVKR